jgi:hypothetical protein
MELERIRALVRQKRHYFYTHALIEAKKDDVSPEDVVYAIRTGKLIERYPKRHRLLVYGTLRNGLPLHVVCDTGQPEVVFIVTVYIPDERQWIRYEKRRS